MSQESRLERFQQQLANTPLGRLRQAFEARHDLVNLRNQVANDEQQRQQGWQLKMQEALRTGNWGHVRELPQRPEDLRPESASRLVEYMEQLQSLEKRYQDSSLELNSAYISYRTAVRDGVSADEITQAESWYEAALVRNYHFCQCRDPDGLAGLEPVEDPDIAKAGIQRHRHKYESAIARREEASMARRRELKQRYEREKTANPSDKPRRFANEGAPIIDTVMARYREVQQRNAGATSVVPDPAHIISTHHGSAGPEPPASAPTQASNESRRFGEREEDWPDPDVDSDTEEGAEAIRLNDAATFMSIARQNRARRGRPPLPEPSADIVCLMLKIPSNLTETERETLLSRGGLVGKALAFPDRLTPEELHSVMEWPSPDIVSMNIRHATDGALSKPAELFSKAKDAYKRDKFDEILTQKEIELLGRNFYDSAAAQFQTTESDTSAVAGAVGVVALLLERMEMTPEILNQARLSPEGRRAVRAAHLPSPAPLPQNTDPVQITQDIITVHKERRQGKITEAEANARRTSLVDALRALPRPDLMTLPKLPDLPTPRVTDGESLRGLGWSPRTIPKSPMAFFKEESGIDDFYRSAGWFASPESLKEIYRRRSEDLRQEGLARHGGADLAPAKFYVMIAGFMCFEKEMQQPHQQVRRIWDEVMSEDERREWEGRARLAEEAALDYWEQRL